MARKQTPDIPDPGAPAWMATYGDLMTLLLCFFVLLFSMSTVDAQKFELIAASFSNSFSIFSGGGVAFGDGLLIGNGVSQLHELDKYINSMGIAAEGSDNEAFDDVENEMEKKGIKASEELAEKISESLMENNLESVIAIDFTSQYVQLTLKGALLFNSGSASLKEETKPILDQVGKILERYAHNIIEIEGHTDTVPIHNSRFANNNELSSFRALAVFDYLNGVTSIEPSQFKHSGRGEHVPIADNSSNEGRAKNRRVEIKIYNDVSPIR